MIGRRQEANARAVLLAARNRFGNLSFKVDPCGSNYRPLRDAEFLGWVWFDGDRCAITAGGMVELEDYKTGDGRPKEPADQPCADDRRDR